MPEQALKVPSLNLIHLLHRAKKTLQTRDYWYAMHYARSKKLFGFFMRLALFFPEPVIHLLNKGKNTGLPRVFLEMPVFHIDAPVYQVAFLGRLQVSKRGMPLHRLKLGPKEASFLIHMSINRNQTVRLQSLYDNFWSRSREPSRNLSHLLMQLKKKLILPSHLLKQHTGALYWRVFFTTDYGLFIELIAQAKVLERAGEWYYARREYLRAFDLFRNTPFYGMYDGWSENMRRLVMNRFESELNIFKTSCLKHKNMAVYNLVKKRFARSIPGI